MQEEIYLSIFTVMLLIDLISTYEMYKNVKMKYDVDIDLILQNYLYAS